MSNGFEFGGSSSGSSGTIVGALVPIVDTINPLFTYKNQDYLRTGVISSIGIYGGLEFTNTYLTLNVGINSNNIFSANSKDALYTNGYYYFTDTTGNLACSTNLTSYTNINGTDGPVTEFFVMGTSVILINTGTATLGYSTTNITTAGIASVTGILCGASNPSGSLAVVVKDINAVSNNIRTSTTPATWTARTPTGGSADAIYRAVWSVSGSKFIYLCASGTLYTTTDGFTLVAGGATGLTAVLATNSGFPSSHSASSNTTTIMTVMASIGGISGAVFVKTVNGTSVTSTFITALLNLDSRQVITVPPRISFGNGIWTMILTPLSGDPVNSLCYRSADDGTTWTKMPIPVNAAFATTAMTFFKYLNTGYVGGLVAASLSRISSHAALLSATHVGLTQKSDNVTSGGATVPNYVAIR